MILIELTPVPNQSLNINLDNNVYGITIQQVYGKNTINNSVVTNVTNVLMAATITRSNISLIDGGRIVPGLPLLPYPYQEAGNFILLATGQDSFVNELGQTIIIPSGNAYADYQQFGISQFLYYATTAELEAIRAANYEALLNGA